MPFPLSLRKQGAGIFQRVRNPLWWNLRLLVTASTSLSVALAQRCWCQKPSNTNTQHFLVHYAWNRYSNTRALQAVVKSCTTAPSSICFPSRVILTVKLYKHPVLCLTLHRRGLRRTVCQRTVPLTWGFMGNCCFLGKAPGLLLSRFCAAARFSWFTSLGLSRSGCGHALGSHRPMTSFIRRSCGLVLNDLDLVKPSLYKEQIVIHYLLYVLELVIENIFYCNDYKTGIALCIGYIFGYKENKVYFRTYFTIYDIFIIEIHSYVLLFYYYYTVKLILLF